MEVIPGRGPGVEPLRSSDVSPVTPRVRVRADRFDITGALGPGASALVPLSQDERAAWARVPADPPPERLHRDTHYFVSNECEIDRVAPLIRNVGNTLVAVGGLNAYLLAGWARSTLIVHIDQDHALAAMHRVCNVAFRCEEPEGFVRWWDPSTGSSAAEVARRLSNGDVEVFEQCRKEVFEFLQESRDGYRSFVNDPVQYQHLCTLAAQGRNIALCGDITRTGAWTQMGEHLQRFGHRVGVYYESNVADFLDPRIGVQRDNVAALPVGIGAVALTTGASGREDWRYELAPLKLHHDYIHSVGIYAPDSKTKPTVKRLNGVDIISA
ncbi:MAG: hypothetical protein AAFX94_13040 [Myxococcota bacterium]